LPPGGHFLRRFTARKRNCLRAAAPSEQQIKRSAHVVSRGVSRAPPMHQPHQEGHHPPQHHTSTAGDRGRISPVGGAAAAQAAPPPWLLPPHPSLRRRACKILRQNAQQLRFPAPSRHNDVDRREDRRGVEGCGQGRDAARVRLPCHADRVLFRLVRSAACCHKL
jgi:hypothetical protein